MIPASYSEWRHCIEEKCNIPLTEPYIKSRLEALQAKESHDTKKFRKLYGDQYWLQVIQWFKQALQGE